jgi:hypothetical protein
MDAPLSLTVSLAQPARPAGAPIYAQVALVNRSQRAITVNGRLALGYADGLERELFFEVQDAETGRTIPVPDEQRVDSHVMPPGQDDFRALAPGASIGRDVDVSVHFPFSKPGRYRIVFHYENRHRGSEFGLDAYVGTVTAEPVVLEVQPPERAP